MNDDKPHRQVDPCGLYNVISVSILKQSPNLRGLWFLVERSV